MRIKAFRFWWNYSWRHDGFGYDSIIETTDSGAVTIRFLVNGKPFDLNLTDRENDFISDLEFVREWDRYEYLNYAEDCGSWNLHFTYDDTTIVTKGANGYPANFGEFLRILHKKYKLPVSGIENGFDKNIIDEERNDDIDRWTIYYY